MADLTNPTSAAVAPCRCLRSKEMFVNAEPDLTVPNSSSGLYWCIHTMNCLGPDGQVADRESCRPGRACYEPV